MKKITLIIALTCTIIACNNKENKTASVNKTLAFKYDSVAIYSKTVVIKEAKTQDAAQSTIKFPVFTDTLINLFLQRKVFDFYGKEEHYANYQDIAISFIKGYDEEQKENKEKDYPWYLNIDLEVLQNQANYLLVGYSNNDYAGGAHPNHYQVYLNYNPTTHTEITLDSLIAKNKIPQLLAIAEKIFRQQEKLTATQTLVDDYFFDNGKFSLAKTFYLNKKGLVFLYNTYEIKAYAYGTTELVVPFSALKNIAKPNSLLHNFNL